MKRLLVILALAFSGCDPNPNAPTTGVDANFNIRTVMHDNHQWIVVCGGYRAGVSMVHHPDCDCFKRAKVEK